jgi:hypothetical protein
VQTLVSSVSWGWLRMNSCRRRLWISWRVPFSPENEQRIHCGLVAEAVVGQHGQAGLGLHWPQRVGAQEHVKFGIKPAGHGEHPCGAAKSMISTSLKT